MSADFGGHGAWLDGKYFTDQTWWRFPKKLRRLWWHRTDFGTRPPDAALLAAVADVLDRQIPGVPDGKTIYGERPQPYALTDIAIAEIKLKRQTTSGDETAEKAGAGAIAARAMTTNFECEVLK
jgi:hypothetical protein